MDIFEMHLKITILSKLIRTKVTFKLFGNVFMSIFAVIRKIVFYIFCHVIMYSFYMCLKLFFIFQLFIAKFALKPFVFMCKGFSRNFKLFVNFYDVLSKLNMIVLSKSFSTNATFKGIAFVINCCGNH